MRIFLPIILCVILFSCGNDRSTDTIEVPTPLSAVMPGVWETISLQVTINSFDNTDSSYVFSIEESEWASKMGIRPIRSYYMPDNKYRRLRQRISDTRPDTSRGIWNTFGDTLLLIEPDATYQYRIQVADNGLTYHETYMDWDGDGNDDDQYRSVHRLVSRSID